MTTCEIKQNRSSDGHPFSEIFIVHNDQHFYSRVWFVIQDSEHARAQQIQDFHKRRKQYDAALLQSV